MTTPESPQAYITGIAKQRRRQRRTAPSANWVTATGGSDLIITNPVDTYITAIRTAEQNTIRQHLGQDLSFVVDDS